MVEFTVGWEGVVIRLAPGADLTFVSTFVPSPPQVTNTDHGLSE